MRAMPLRSSAPKKLSANGAFRTVELIACIVST
jgi:hypothetical protein